MFHVFLMTLAALAARAEVTCTALQFEIINGVISNRIEKTLEVESRIGTTLRLGADIGDHYYSLVGDSGSGDFLITQASGPDYVRGINATGSFSSTGRLQISLVDGNKVFKLECLK